MKLGKNIVIDLTAKRGSARLQMLFGASYVPPKLSAETFAAMQKASLASAKLGMTDDAKVDPSLTFDQVNPQDADFIYPQFRALSQTMIPGYFIDFSENKVVEDAAPLMLGQTIYTNHYYYEVENWIGAVSQSTWDPKGDKVGGVPGINVELKIDWKMNPKIARGLLMKPPAIHSVSATVDFEWDASHPDLLEQGIFWRNLGLDIDRSIVRIVVNKITAFYELSLVFQGANPESNGHLPEDDDEETKMSAPALAAPKPPIQLVKSKEKTKVKFTATLIAALAALGFTVTAEEEVAEDRIQAMLAGLATRATAADAIVAADRAEVLRVATLAEGEGAEKALPPSLATMIEKADASQLPGLKTLYTERAAAKFTQRCVKCGSTEMANRSSVEDAPVVMEQSAPVPTTNLL
jgi:hypothetical protein